MHRSILIFEKNKVRILDVQIAPGEITQYHVHAQPMFYISLGWEPHE